MQFYVAARYERKHDATFLSSQLEASGHRTTSRWLSAEHEVYALEDGRLCMEWSLRDVEDVKAADVLILLTDPAGTPLRGGKHVETGVAFAADKRVVLVGERENIFHWMPGVTLVEDYAGAVALLDHWDRDAGLRQRAASA